MQTVAFLPLHCDRPGLDAATCPLEFIHDEHFRHRALYDELEALAASPTPGQDLSARLLLHLHCGLPLHQADEDSELFPRLLKRARPGDEVRETIALMQGEHGDATGARAVVATLLLELAQGRADLHDDDRDLIRRFAASKRRHMLLEEALILPLARARLDAAERMRLLDGMRARNARAPLVQPKPLTV